MSRRSTFGRGLSRVEVLVLIAMCWVLGAFLFTWRVTAGARDAKVACMSNLREIGKGCVMYSGDFNDYYPSVRPKGSTLSKPMTSLALIYDQYVSSKKVFVCPATTDDCRDLHPGASDSFIHQGELGRR